MYFHMNKHHKKVMKRQKNVQSNAQVAKIFCDLCKVTLKMQKIIKQTSPSR